jgi:methylenetetrahydrofolate reductase (NADPH)
LCVKAGQFTFSFLTATYANNPLKTFKDALRTTDFAVTAEIYLRPETDADSLRWQAELLKDDVDAILLTDNQYGQLHMSTIAAASILLNAGVDPIVQLTCRNRNRIALISDLLGAAALGVTSLLLMTGERAPADFKPKPKPVLDLSINELIHTAAMLKDDESLDYCPDFLVGGVVTPLKPKPSWKARKLTEKVDAGAQYMQTHICMDMQVLSAYVNHLVMNNFVRRTSVIGAVAVLESVQDAQWLIDNRPCVKIPASVIDRLKAADDPKAEGIRICAETLRSMARIPGMSGANIMAARDLNTIPEVIRMAGIT